MSFHFGKMYQTRWLIDAIRRACKGDHWKLAKYITIDEMMVKYKGSYCWLRQYTSKKLVKWELNFIVLQTENQNSYMILIFIKKKNQAILENKASMQEEYKFAHQVVTNLIAELKNKGHVVIMNNYFTSIGFSHNLEC